MAAAELLKWQLIEFGDLVQGRLIRESPKSIDETGRGVIEMIIWFKRQTIRSLKLKPIVGVEWDLKRCVDELGNQMADTQMFKRRYPAEMILLPEIFIQDDGAIDRKVRVLCGVDGEATQLTDLHCNYLEKIRFLEKKLAVMSGSLHAKEYDEGLARADVATYLSHHVDIVAMAKGKKHIDTVDEDEEKLRGEELKKKEVVSHG